MPPSPLRLTSDNLERLDTPADAFQYFPHACYKYPSSCVSSSSSHEDADDTASIFSSASVSTCVSAPEDEEPPYQVTDSYGQQVAVYSSFDQAVRYSLMRVAAMRREEESRPPVYGGLYNGEEDEDDAYFSMG